MKNSCFFLAFVFKIFDISVIYFGIKSEVQIQLYIFPSGLPCLSKTLLVTYLASILPY